MNNQPLNLPQEITIRTVSEVKNLLTDILNQEGCITLNAEPVSRIDTVGLQLLLAFEQTVANEGRNAQLLNASETILKVSQTLGLSLMLTGEQIDDSE
jgi:anti-anti-sigma factor